MQRETEILGGGPLPPKTAWSVLLAARDPQSPRFDDARNSVAKSYWRPVYHHIRRQWKRSVEEAKDLTQGFFVAFFEKRFLEAVTPQRGRFRTFLYEALENYLRNARDYERAQKRGGGQAPLSLDFQDDLGPFLRLAPSPAPADAFTEAWRAQILRAAALELESVYRRDGKEAYAAVFAAYVLEDSPESYRDLAARLGIKEGDVLNYLRHARELYRSTLRRLVWESVSGEEEFRAEMRELFGV